MRALVLLPSCILSGIVLGVVLYGLHTASAQVSSSGNYQLQSDSVNFGGGLSSSSQYVQESTFGEVATGRSTSTSFQLRAGYQQLQTSFTSLSVTGDVSMNNPIPGITGGIANGSTTATVVTDNAAGYQLFIDASNDPAMEQDNGSATIADYPATSPPDDTFTVGAAQAYFGFTVEGVDIATDFEDDGAGTCGGGGQDTLDTCWRGLATSDITIANRTSSNHPDGSTTTLKFRVEATGGANLPSGEYTATSTLTVLPL